MLFRFYLNPQGRIGAFQYRHFLFQYWFFFIPGAGFIFLALLWIGVRYPEGAVKEMSFWQVEFGIYAYVALCIWPLIACTLRRLHDLDLRVKDVIWVISPTKSRELGKRMFSGRGTVGPNGFGPDPEALDESRQG